MTLGNFPFLSAINANMDWIVEIIKRQTTSPVISVLQSLQSITVLRKYLNGWIELQKNGKGVWVEVEREVK